MDHLRREKRSLSREHSDIDLTLRCDFSEIFRDHIVLVLIQSIELLLVVNCDDSNPALVLDGDD
jgi:hypothetical protein